MNSRECPARLASTPYFARLRSLQLSYQPCTFARTTNMDVWIWKQIKLIEEAGRSKFMNKSVVFSVRNIIANCLGVVRYNETRIEYVLQSFTTSPGSVCNCFWSLPREHDITTIFRNVHSYGSNKGNKEIQMQEESTEEIRIYCGSWRNCNTKSTCPAWIPGDQPTPKPSPGF